MAENKTVKNNRERLLGRYAKKSPDRQFADDDDLFGQINDDFDGYDKQIQDFQEQERQMTGLFAKDPRSAAVFSNWVKGEDPVIYMMRNLGDDFKAALDDPEKIDDLAKAHQEWLDRVAKEQEYRKQYDANMAQTTKDVDAVQEKFGLTDDQMNEVTVLMCKVVSDGVLGKFSPETIELFVKAYTRDSDIAAAKHEGEVAGKNAKIDAKLRKQSKSDGTAVLNGRNGGGGGGAPQPDYGAIGNNYGTKNIWERGGERRSRK